jgi:hypothetical protein
MDLKETPIAFLCKWITFALELGDLDFSEV